MVGGSDGRDDRAAGRLRVGPPRVVNHLGLLRPRQRLGRGAGGTDPAAEGRRRQLPAANPPVRRRRGDPRIPARAHAQARFHGPAGRERGGPLAAEQQAGRLTIRPQSVVSASEVLSATAAQEMEDAWGSAPFDVYAATETAGVASPCRYRNRHLYEDLLIVEPVDASGSPVPPGTVAAKLLVTVLFSRTIPLIRYEMTDQLSLDGRECPCGRRFMRASGVEGRLEDVLHLPGPSGKAEIHPNVFHRILDSAGTTGWQVKQGPHGLTVLLAGLPSGTDTRPLGGLIGQALGQAGAGETPVRLELVEEIPRTALGKAPLVQALRQPPTAPPGLKGRENL